VRTALWAEFPANREFYREIWRFLLAFTDGAARHPTQLTALSSLWRTVVAQKEQGIFLRYQGIEIHCYGFEQRKIVIPFISLSLEAPSNFHYIDRAVFEGGLHKDPRLDW
jgi:hypothetical protein